MGYTKLSIKNQSIYKNSILIENSSFESIKIKYLSLKSKIFGSNSIWAIESWTFSSDKGLLKNNFKNIIFSMI